MLVWVIFIAFFLSIVSLITLTNLKFAIEIHQENQKHQFRLGCFILGICIFQKKKIVDLELLLKAIKNTHDKQYFQILLYSIFQRDVAKQIVKCVRIRQAHLHLYIGISEPAVLGYIKGILEALLHPVWMYINESSSNNFNTLSIQPMFYQEMIKVNFNCIFQVKLVHIISKVFKFLPIVK